MKWLRLIMLLPSIVRAVKRAFDDGRRELADKRQRDSFERANSDIELPLYKHRANR